MRRIWMLLLLLSAGLVAACGSPTTPSPTASAHRFTPASSPPTGPPVLGAAVAGGDGFGSVAPSAIFSPATFRVSEITWTGWGSSNALGTGRPWSWSPGDTIPVEGPAGIHEQLRASGMGECHPGGPPAYTVLSLRQQSRPGGEYGPWQPLARDYGTPCAMQLFAPA